MAKEAWQCGMEVVVDDLSITTSFGKRLLQHISCAVSSGDLVALMGPSGAGKTTLLNALAGRSGDSGGRISYGGKAFQQVRSSLGYVTQEDEWGLTSEEVCLTSHRIRRAVRGSWGG
eukprot:g33619.t1